VAGWDQCQHCLNPQAGKLVTEVCDFSHGPSPGQPAGLTLRLGPYRGSTLDDDPHDGLFKNYEVWVRSTDGSVRRHFFDAAGYRYEDEFIAFYGWFGDRMMSFGRSLVESIGWVSRDRTRVGFESSHYSGMGHDHAEWEARRLEQTFICVCECGIRNGVPLPIKSGTWIACGTCGRRPPITSFD
jgi:hypothetical protein